MRWINFPDGSKYTLAVDIQKFAEQHGYTVPCESDGTRHPGTDCNAKMRTILKDAGGQQVAEGVPFLQGCRFASHIRHNRAVCS